MNRFGLGTVIGVAIVSAAAGFAVRGLIRPSPPPAPPVAWEPLPLQPIPAPAPPPPPVIAQVQVPQRPRIEPIVLPSAAPPPPAAPDLAAPPVAVAPSAPAAKRVVVPYRALEGSAQRIIIPVTFNGRVTAQLALDTGAPSMLITYPLAARIGVLREGDTG